MSKLIYAAAAALLAAAAAAPSRQTPAAAQTASPQVSSVDADGAALQEIQQLLDRRAAALNNKDRESFLATVDEGQSTFFEAQRRFFERCAGLPLGSFRTALDYRDGPEITRKRDRDAHQGQVVVASVDHHYVIEGYDRQPVLRDLTYTFVKRDDGWRVASDTDMEDLGEFTDRELWEFGPVQTKHSEHFLLLFHPDQAPFADDLLASAESALPDVDAVWKRPWHKKVPIQVPSNRAELERLLETTFDVSSFVAFAVSSLDRRDEDAWELGGHRIVLNRENFLRHNEAGRRSILAHELLHIATRDLSGPFTTAVVDEGLAQLTGDSAMNELNSQIRARRFDRKLPKSWEFNTGGRSQIFNAYDESLSAFLFMKERFGIEGVNAFYEALGRARVEPGTDDHRLDAALNEVFKISLAQFEQQWADYAVRKAG